MSDEISKITIRPTKTTAVLTAVVFLLAAVAGCHHSGRHNRAEHTEIHRGQYQSDKQQSPRRPARRRARDYSRLPGNYPADWQRSTIGR